MLLTEKKHPSSARPKPDNPIRRNAKHRCCMWIFPITGLLALIWFLIRVIPKPSRASYPCQRIAFPLASGFVIWLTSALASITAIRKAKRCFAQSRYVLCIMLVILSVGSIWFAQSLTTEDVLLAADPTANAPIGLAKGIHPGRVVWVHDPDATDWAGPGNGYWWQPAHTNQAAVDRMMTRAIQTLAGPKRHRRRMEQPHQALQ